LREILAAFTFNYSERQLSEPLIFALLIAHKPPIRARPTLSTSLDDLGPADVISSSLIPRSNEPEARMEIEEAALHFVRR
jgi:hypothetical protein